MSALTMQVSIKCSRCKAPLKIAGLQTTQADPDLKQLGGLVRMLENNALCPRCQAGLKYYVQMGRGSDWQAGRP